MTILGFVEISIESSRDVKSLRQTFFNPHSSSVAFFIISYLPYSLLKGLSFPFPCIALILRPKTVRFLLGLILICLLQPFFVNFLCVVRDMSRCTRLEQKAHFFEGEKKEIKIAGKFLMFLHENTLWSSGISPSISTVPSASEWHTKKRSI